MIIQSYILSYRPPIHVILNVTRPPSLSVDGMDVILGITDGRRGALEPLLTAIGAAAEPVPYVCVINKTDVLGPRAVSWVVTLFTRPLEYQPKPQFNETYHIEYHLSFLVISIALTTV